MHIHVNVVTFSHKWVLFFLSMAKLAVVRNNAVTTNLSLSVLRLSCVSLESSTGTLNPWQRK